jgi:hypothetical protein
VAIWLGGLAVGAALVTVVVLTRSARRRAASREARRVEELGRLAERLEASLGAFRTRPPRPPVPVPQIHPAPLVAGRLPGRAALLEALTTDVERARSRGARLTAVVVRAEGETSPPELVDAIREAAGRPAYAVGPGVAAFTLPDLGRASGLGVLARIESTTPATGRAVEWAPRESAVELVARLLESPPSQEPG